MMHATLPSQFPATAPDPCRSSCPQGALLKQLPDPVPPHLGWPDEKGTGTARCCACTYVQTTITSAEAQSPFSSPHTSALVPKRPGSKPLPADAGLAARHTRLSVVDQQQDKRLPKAENLSSRPSAGALSATVLHRAEPQESSSTSPAAWLVCFRQACMKPCQ